MLINMHGIINLKIVTAQQTRIVWNCKNKKVELFQTKAALCFNEVCRRNHPTRKYTHIKEVMKV